MNKFVRSPKIIQRLPGETSEDPRPTIKEVYKDYLKSLTYEPHYIDRDGDLFRVSCPECGSGNLSYLMGGFFVCGRKHLFHVYPEDGVRADSELSDDKKKRVLGDDLQKDGRDSHGHGEYEYFPKEGKVQAYFQFYFGYDSDDEDRTFEKAVAHIDYLKEKLEAFSNKFDRFYLPYLYFYTDLLDAAGGKPSSDLKSWPEDMLVQKFVLIKDELKKINKVFESVDKSRGYSLLYNFKKV
jgi:hypothetical protein